MAMAYVIYNRRLCDILTVGADRLSGEIASLGKSVPLAPRGYAAFT
jgi:hypothetical protein